MSSIKIGILLDNTFADDIRVTNEAFALANAGFQIIVYCFAKKEDYPHKNIHVVPVGISNYFKNKFRPLVNFFPLYFWIWRFKLNRFLREFQIDVLHIHDLYLAVPVIKCKLAKELHLVLDLHENYPAAIMNYKWSKSFLKLLIRPEQWKKKEKLLLKGSDSIVVLSNHYKNYLAQKYDIDLTHFFVYPNVPDVNRLLSYKIDRNIFEKGDLYVILYFGVIAERRGLKVIIESIPLLKKLIPNFTFLLIGPIDNSDKDYFNRNCNFEEIKNHIKYVGYQDIEKLPSWINKSDVCISPIHKSEQHDIGVANKVFQYMLFEKPVIVSDSLAQKELVQKEKCGLVFEHDSPKDLAEKIYSLYNNSDKSMQFGINGKNAVLAKYNLIKYSKSLVDLYKNVESSIEQRYQ